MYSSNDLTYPIFYRSNLITGVYSGAKNQTIKSEGDENHFIKNHGENLTFWEIIYSTILEHDCARIDIS